MQAELTLPARLRIKCRDIDIVEMQEEKGYVPPIVPDI
jgi:hypothetical protein